MQFRDFLWKFISHLISEQGDRLVQVQILLGLVSHYRLQRMMKLPLFLFLEFICEISSSRASLRSYHPLLSSLSLVQLSGSPLISPPPVPCLALLIVVVQNQIIKRTVTRRYHLFSKLTRTFPSLIKVYISVEWRHQFQL